MHYLITLLIGFALAGQAQPGDPTTRPDGFTDADLALRDAATRGDVKAISAALEAGARIDAKDSCDDTPIWDAVAAGQADAVRALLEKGADPNIAAVIHTPLMVATIARANRLEMVKLLIAHGAQVNARDYKRRSVLTYAVSKKDAEVIAYLKSKGAVE